MLSEPLISGSSSSNANAVLAAETPIRSNSVRQGLESSWIFDELPKASIVLVSRPDTGDISPMLLSYTIEFQYKQFKWRLLKKASQVLYLHFALKKRAIIEEFHEKQEQVREWLESLGIGGDHQTTIIHDDEGIDDEAVPSYNEENVKNRYVPSSAAFPIIRPALGRQQSISDRAKVAMQGYLNHFLGNMDIANSKEVCKFLEVSKLSFLQEYGPKLKENYVMVKHLPSISTKDDKTNCCTSHCFPCCKNNWQKVWAVLKPGFFALLEDPFAVKPLDILVFDVLPTSDKNGKGRVYLANEIKDRNPLRYTFKVSCGDRSIKIRTSSSAKVREWVAAINDTCSKPPEGWCHPHRFSSFAPPRGLVADGSQAQWFVDGKATFEAIASAIEAAKSEIFITGWWVCPELYLRRPFDTHGPSRLDDLLLEKAKQGIQIYILLYKEVALALKINSFYSKRMLLNIHENVKVLRYPDHLSSGIYLWSHHEKLVIIDYQICFIGGLDLCFGRYDTIEHKVGDSPSLLWPGKDYYNPREIEPNSWEDMMKDELDRKKYPRMPWHDVHCALWGPPCIDIARHFVQRWNFAKTNKALHEQKIPLLMPRHHMVIPHYMKRSSDIATEMKKAEQSHIEAYKQGSVSSQSPSQDIPLLFPQEADRVHACNVDKKSNEAHINQNSKVESRQPNQFIDHHDFFLNGQSEMYLGLLDSDISSSDEWQETPEQEYNAVSSDETGQVGPRVSCYCQVIRSVTQWSAGTSQTEASIHVAHCSLIEKSEHFIYMENQFFISGLTGDEIIQNRILEALYKRILRAHKEQKCFRVIVVIPLIPGFQGGIDDGGAATVRAIMHWQYRTICRGKHSILHSLGILLGPNVHDYISFYGLRSYGSLFDGGPVATSQVYVHSKVMIIDDRIAFIGSSNINDRSLLGSRDSEIGVVIEDKDFVESSMNGEPWKAGKFSHSLRVSLWSEHLGLLAGENNQISDPIIDATFKDLWLATAKENSTIYHEVFSCIPNDVIHSRSELRQSMAQRKEKLGHNTIDLGIAIAPSAKLEATDLIHPLERLNAVKGFLVSFPLDFMNQEDLRPVFNESEFYAFPQVFR